MDFLCHPSEHGPWKTPEELFPHWLIVAVYPPLSGSTIVLEEGIYRLAVPVLVVLEERVHGSHDHGALQVSVDEAVFSEAIPVLHAAVKLDLESKILEEGTVGKRFDGDFVSAHIDCGTEIFVNVVPPVGLETSLGQQDFDELAIYEEQGLVWKAVEGCSWGSGFGFDDGGRHRGGEVGSSD